MPEITVTTQLVIYAIIAVAVFVFAILFTLSAIKGKRAKQYVCFGMSIALAIASVVFSGCVPDMDGTIALAVPFLAFTSGVVFGCIGRA